MVDRALHRVLVVEDDARLGRALVRALAPHFAEVRSSRSVATARGALGDFWPDLVLLDFALPDGDAFAVLDTLRAKRPAPVVVILSGQAEPGQTFELARRGARAFLPKPVDLGRLEAILRRAAETPPDLGPALRGAVGVTPLPELATGVRGEMVKEALARTGGSRRGAARLLGISRQLLQYLLRRQD